MNKNTEKDKDANQRDDAAQVMAIIQRAALLVQQGQLKKSLQELKQDNEIALADPRGQCILGVVLNSMGQPEKALEAFDLAVRIAPQLPEAHNNRANILKSLNRLDESLEAYDEALKLRHSYPEAHYNRGHALMRLDRLEEALEAYDEAIALRPAYPEAHNNRGNVLKSLDRLEDALGAYDEALLQEPAYVMAHSNRGIVLNRLNRPDEALAAYDAALKLQPENADAHCNRGNLLKELGRMDEALEAYDKALELEPDDLRAGNNRATLLGDIGKIDEALDAYDAVLKHDKTFARALINRGTLLMEVGRLEDAQHTFNTVLAQPGPHSIKTLYALSQLPAQLIDADILSLIEKAQPEDNDNKEEFLSLQAAARATEYDKAGRHEEAWENIVASNKRPYQQKQAEYFKSRQLRHKVLTWLRSDPPATLPKDEPGHPLSLHILGTSRSGKTTCETLVSALDGVARGFESSIVQDALHQAFEELQIPHSELALELPPRLEDKWRDCYFAAVEKKAPGAQIFTNTHPGNLRAVFRMATALPNSRFVFMKRDFNDVRLRIYMKHYRSGNAYAYDIDTITEYVTWYNDMLDILNDRFPEISLVVHYEDMVANPAKVLADLAKLCVVDTPKMVELPWLGDDRGCAKGYGGRIPVDRRQSLH